MVLLSSRPKQLLNTLATDVMKDIRQFLILAPNAYTNLVAFAKENTICRLPFKEGPENCVFLPR